MSADPQVGLRFRIQHPDGKQETLLVDAERALIGSAAHCEVRLPSEVSAHQHVEVYANAGVIRFSTCTLGHATPPLLDGVATFEGQWAKGTVLSLGGVQLLVDLADLAPPKARFPVWAVAVGVALLSVFGAATFVRAPAGARTEIPAAPTILPKKGAAVCPDVPLDQRGGLATEKQRIALAKRERSPFSPHDGIEAVLYFETAAACFRAAGQGTEAAQAERNADGLREKIDDDYRVRRIRLEHAYRLHDPVAMKRELIVLIPMTSQERGPYTERLAALDRAATVEIAKKGRLR